MSPRILVNSSESTLRKAPSVLPGISSCPIFSSRVMDLSVNNNLIETGGGGVEQTECSVEQLSFQGVGKREIVARFDGGQLSSDGGGLLLREVERGTGLLSQFAACFRDYRNPILVEHSLKSLISQRVVG